MMEKYHTEIVVRGKKTAIIKDTFSLKDMIVDMPKEIENVFSDYKMNLLEVRDSGKYRFQNEELQTVFEVTREAFAGHFENIRNKYGTKKISGEVLSVIGKMTGAQELVKMGENQEVDNVCTALEKFKQEGIDQGIEQGVEQEKKERIHMMLGKGYSASEIAEIFEMTEADIEKIGNEK